MTIFQFPPDFRWGVATAAYQIEGATQEDGRGLSIWDTFARTPGKVLNGDNGDVACDSYHRWTEDIALMKQLGVTMYRFSIAWPRIYPNGTGEVNEKGLEFYETFVDALLEAGIEPLCTLYHWDLPQKLQDSGGWTNRETIDAFVHYSETVFKRLNGKIKNWITFNEPWCVSFLSHELGAHAPGWTDFQAALDVAHHLLVAHGRTVRRFRELGMAGAIGYAPNTEWFVPYSRSEADLQAAKRRHDYFNTWFFEPVFRGSYPQEQTAHYESKGFKLNIQPGDMEDISQPIDFVGINYYTGGVAKDAPGQGILDIEVVDTEMEKTDFDWNVYPEGFYQVLRWVKDTYGDIPIFITENGACYEAEKKDGRVKDRRRTQFLRRHLIALHRAIESGVNVKGYMQWSLLDNFEWAYGYTKPFGLVHVDFRTLERTPKESFYWYRSVARNNWFSTNDEY
ncbi:BglA [Paenibacillus mucilaginosus 3016]|uniref:Beta-glucosidase n=1 Tax=Paenibacillus mucilaginosus 3016 TaxID=1116391 RepID=H6NMQ2_9BACL|nr:GH1 family beta-glucosidase [Paenibacillus mucilaginosus]AFC30389.1 BglA [Paenibacillus mucilaginosus 3016]WFA19027.1 beta-glucosidase [Paenibacillus mucilaginosus]